MLIVKENGDYEKNMPKQKKIAMARAYDFIIFEILFCLLPIIQPELQIYNQNKHQLSLSSSYLDTFHNPIFSYCSLSAFSQSAFAT